MKGRRLAFGARIALWLGLAAVGLAVDGSAAPAGTELEWPDTELSVRVQEWIAQMSGSEDDARAFFEKNFSPESLAEVTMVTRLTRRRLLVTKTGGLTPLQVLTSTPTHMEVKLRASNGDEPTLVVEAEDAPPYLMKSVRVALAGSTPTGPPAPTGPPLTDDEAVAEIRKNLDESAASGKFSGVVLLARDGRPLLRQAWGVADRTQGAPVTPETRFNLGSLGKIPTRVAIAQLAEQNKLSIDDKLAKFLPDFPRANDITIHMLAKHRSGVGEVFNKKFEEMDRSKLLHNRDYLELLRDQPLLFEPGERQEYSNGGFVLLGEVIAKASGMDYYDYLEDHVYGPAGMKSTAALIEGDGTPNVARGYTTGGVVNGPEHDNVDTRPWRGSAAGGSYSTVDDFLAFDQALVHARLCSADWASWACGGPRPAPSVPSFALGGAAPGICTEWLHEGALTLIMFTNRDPDATRPLLEPVRKAFKRMKP